MRRYCPNCKLLVDGETAVCPHCLQSLPRLVSVQVKRSHTTIPTRSTWEKIRRVPKFFRKVFLLAFGLLFGMIGLLSTEYVLALFGLGLSVIALLGLLSPLRQKQRGAKLDLHSTYVNKWLDELAKKDRKE